MSVACSLFGHHLPRYILIGNVNLRYGLSRRVQKLIHIRQSTSGISGVLTQVDEIHIEDEYKARSLVAALTPEERKRLQIALGELEKQPRLKMPIDKRLSREQTWQLFLVNSIPFIGFGFLDNVIMIIAGEYIDQTIGAWLTLSTMAAAALGNTMSDVCGVGLTHYVEFVVSKCGIKHPVLNSEQLESAFARTIVNVGRAIGLTAGCIIGMFPLLFYDAPKAAGSKSEGPNEGSTDTAS